MSVRDVDPAVWAAAYGTAFVRLYEHERGTNIYPVEREEALHRAQASVHHCIAVADGAVRALHPHEPDCAPTPEERARRLEERERLLNLGRTPKPEAAR